jgi:Kef-type K+ transport system membrane component KefB
MTGMMALLEPYVIPGFDWLVLKLLCVIGIILFTGVVITLSSIVGLIRAVRRRRRGGRSIAAVMLATVAVAIVASWSLYWAADAAYHHENPLNGFLAINFAICLLPLSWLTGAIRANLAPNRPALDRTRSEFRARCLDTTKTEGEK